MATEAAKLATVLKDFTVTSITLDPSTTRMNNAVLKEQVESKLMAAMKTVDPLFNKIFQNIRYMGSYYDGLRIKEADEFDFNIVLKLPWQREQFEVIESPDSAGYVKYKLKNSLQDTLAGNQNWSIYKNLAHLMDDSMMYLSQQKTNRWLQSVVDKALITSQIRNMRRSYHGPATTLYVFLDNGKTLDVDLVPVVQIPDFPTSVRKPNFLGRVPQEKKDVFIVPKSYPDNSTVLLWRVSIPGVEYFLIDNKGCLKLLIKIFKAIRDNYHWKKIASYYIKTLFLYAAEEHQDDYYWREAKLGELFIEMIDKFIAVIRARQLDHFFFVGFNFLSDIRDDTADILVNTLQNIRKAATSNVSKLPALLKEQPRTPTQLNDVPEPPDQAQPSENYRCNIL